MFQNQAARTGAQSTNLKKLLTRPVISYTRLQDLAFDLLSKKEIQDQLCYEILVIFQTEVLLWDRLMTISSLYACGESCSRGTHDETAKNLALFSSIINGIMKESRIRISIPWECYQFFNRIEHSITFTP